MSRETFVQPSTQSHIDNNQPPLPRSYPVVAASGSRGGIQFPSIIMSSVILSETLIGGRTNA